MTGEARVAAITLAPVTEQTIAGESTNPQSGPDRDGSSGARENPTTDPKAFEPVEGTPAKRNKETGEIWERDKLHKDHYEVYKNKKKYDNGKRTRSVWQDGRFKEKF